MDTNAAHDGLGQCGPTSLLLLQAIETCNLDCSYCYLPNREKSGRMALGTAVTAARWVRENGLLGSQLEVLWHAGEPLIAGLEFFREAHAAIRQEMPVGFPIEFAFQTNATLIDDRWAAFFAESGSQIGVSIDGPMEWHDARRKTWGGKGTFDRVVAGIECLKRHRVPFSTVSVISASALADPSRLYDFLVGLGAESFGFNDEEREGIHIHSVQYASPAAKGDAERFYASMYDLATRDGNVHRVREVSKALRAMSRVGRLRRDEAMRGVMATELSDPFRILNVGFDGRFSTFAPELLGHRVTEIGDFVFGNVERDTLTDVLGSPRFQKALSLISAGVHACRETCEYYQLCGGGSPSNKYFETRSLASSRTVFCQLSIMAPVNAVLSRLESEAASARLCNSQARGG